MQKCLLMSVVCTLFYLPVYAGVPVKYSRSIFVPLNHSDPSAVPASIISKKALTGWYDSECLGYVKSFTQIIGEAIFLLSLDDQYLICSVPPPSSSDYFELRSPSGPSQCAKKLTGYIFEGTDSISGITTKQLLVNPAVYAPKDPFVTTYPLSFYSTSYLCQGSADTALDYPQASCIFDQLIWEQSSVDISYSKCSSASNYQKVNGSERSRSNTPFSQLVEAFKAFSFY